MSNIKQIINEVFSPNLKVIPKLSINVSQSDAQQLENTINSNPNKKQTQVLRILLAEVYKALGNERCLRVITEVNCQALQQTPYITDAKLRICGVIIDSFDHYKIDMVKTLINQLTYNPETSQGRFKSRLDVIKVGFQALQQNYYKAALGYLNASKDQAIADDKSQKINLIQKSIATCLLAQKSHELHQLICQLHVNSIAKQSQFYPLLTKLYEQCMIQPSDIKLISKLMPLKFQKKDSDNISLSNRVIFKHNMISIMKSFQNISLGTLGELIVMKKEDLLLLIQKSFSSKQIQVDQVSGYVFIKSDPHREQALVKTFFDSMENLIIRTDLSK